MVVAILVCVLGTWREIPHLPDVGKDHERFSLLTSFAKRPGRSATDRFARCSSVCASSTIMLSAEGVLTPYMNVHFWGLTTEQISTIPAVSMFGLIIGFMLTPLRDALARQEEDADLLRDARDRHVR